MGAKLVGCGEFDKFINSVEKRLNKKRKSKKSIRKIIDALIDKYYDSPIFEPIDPREFSSSDAIFDVTRDNVIVGNVIVATNPFHREDERPSVEEQSERVERIQKRLGEVWFTDEEEEDEVNIRGMFGRTPIHTAAGENKYSLLKKYVLKEGGSVLIKDNNGQTPRVFAEMSNADEKIIAFLEKHEDIQREQKFTRKC